MRQEPMREDTILERTQIMANATLQSHPTAPMVVITMDDQGKAIVFSTHKGEIAEDLVLRAHRRIVRYNDDDAA
jgi:hypothetical protein